MADGILKVGTITTSSGSGTITLGQSGETIAAPTGVNITGRMSASPTFNVRLSSSQSISSGSWTKVQLDTKVWDTDSAFDTTNYKFVVPTGKTGKYRFSFGGYMDGAIDNKVMAFRLYKNDTADNYTYTQATLAGTGGAIPVNTSLLDLVVGDEICVYFYQNTGASKNLHSSYMRFEGERLIGAE